MESCIHKEVNICMRLLHMAHIDSALAIVLCANIHFADPFCFISA